MAEVAAAPSAPSPSAPTPSAAEPGSAAPNTGTLVPDSGTISPVRDAAEADTTPRLAKPIKPIPRLPGVFPDDDPFPPPPPSSDADAPANRAAAPHRGPDGRFVATSSATPPGSGEHTLEPAPADAAAGPFEFAGEKFATREAAEQNFKSLRGQFKPLQSLARSVGGVDKIAPTLASAAESARGWKGEADRLRAELNAYRSGNPPAATPSTPTAQPAEQADQAADVDWDLYAEVKKLATERGEPWKAEQWLIEQVRAADRAHLQKQLDERDAPLKAQQAREAVAAQTENLFGSLADYTNADGSPAFPELGDEAAAYEVGKLWASLGLPPQSALTPQGAIAAIALYRMTKPPESQARPAPIAPPQPTAPSAPQPTDTLSAASLVDGRPTVASVGANGSPSAEAARILAGLRSANSGNRSVLGFDA